MKTILIIDDDEPIRLIYGMALQQKGYHTLSASGGPEGLALARQHLPDLILCDINMPGMDGRSVLQALREDAELGSKQIVLMTGNIRNVTPRAGMELGADDFLVKPFTIEELDRCVEARLKRAQVNWRVEDKVVADLRSSVHNTLPHEFLTPLAGIMGLTDILVAEYPGMSAAEMHDIHLDIAEAGKRLHRTLKNYFNLLDLSAGIGASEPPSGLLPPSGVKAAVLRGTEQAALRHKRTADLTVQVDECSLSVSEQALTMIVEELVDNACNFSRAGSPIAIQMSVVGKLTVKDAGRGMQAQQVEQIGAFRQFDRKKYEQQGLGLGLILTQKLVAQQGGHLSLTSKPGAGTTVAVIFQTRSVA